MISIERRQRNQVKNSQRKVDAHHVGKNSEYSGQRIQPGRVISEQQQLGDHQTDKRHQNVGERTCETGDNNPFVSVAEMHRVDRHRSGEAEAEEQNHDRTDRIDMVERVEADPFIIAGGRISHLVGRPGMRGLVDRDGGHQHNNPGEQPLQGQTGEKAGKHGISPLCIPILYREKHQKATNAGRDLINSL